MNKIKTLLLSLFLISFIYANAKEEILKGNVAHQKIAGASLIRMTDASTIPNYIVFADAYQLDFNQFDKWYHGQFKLNANYNKQLISADKDALGFTHYRYKQTYNGYVIENSMFLLHVKNGKIVSMNGLLFNTLNGNAGTAITEPQALQYALNNVNAIQYKWQVPAAEAMLKAEQKNNNATFYPVAQMMWIQKNNTFKLCYAFNVYAAKPLSRTMQFVDAQSGQIIETKELIHTTDVVGSAITKYSGTQPITTDSYTGGFRLQETGRGNGIQTYDCQTTTNYNNTDFSDADNTWNNINATQDEVATDAHWGAEMTYDYYNSVHNRNSIDGNGFALLSYVHYDVNFVNAFWDGQRMTYGDGDASTPPLTCIDVTGHEITHGVTEHSSNLDYSYESGALNEGFSDIFGKLIEHYARPNNNSWFIGLDLGSPFRNMANPTSLNDPGFYQGQNWYTGTADNGGVHTNSGVVNHWFYILTAGDTGVNEANNNYSVAAQGYLKSGAIAYRTNMFYLINTSQYSDARFYSIISAQDLYGGCSPEVEAVTNAWYAVGLGSLYVPYTVSDFSSDVNTSCTAPLTVNFVNLSINGTTYSWDFGDGSPLSTLNNPSHIYNVPGNYTVSLISNGGVCGIDTGVQVNYIVINPSLACITMPSGTSTVTNCSGLLYDNGGVQNDYTNNFSGTVTIAPIGATNVSLNFSSFNTEAGYDFLTIYDGPNTTSTLLGTYDGTSLPNGGLNIVSSGPSITIKFVSDQGVAAAGFAMNWQCAAPPIPPVTAFVANQTFTCSGSVQFIDQSSNIPTSWLWSFGDGITSTAQNPMHQYLLNGTYTVKLVTSNAFGTDSLTQTNYITMNQPAAPSAIGDSTCLVGSVTLTATPNNNGQLNWYATPTGGASLGTGTSFTTPTIVANTNYYVDETIAGTLYNVGPLDNTFGTGGAYTGNNVRYLIFDVTQACTLVSVDVYASTTGNRTIKLVNPAGVVTQTVTYNFTNTTGVTTVPLNFLLSAGTGYHLELQETGTANNLYRNSASAAFPYANGPVTITGTNSINNANYYYFYNWVVSEGDCISARTTVTATFGSGNVPATATIISANNVCQPATVTIQANAGATQYQWLQNGTNISNATNATYDATASGNYSVIVGVAGCTSGTSASTSVTIYPKPNADFTYSTSNTGAVTFTDGSTGANSYFWDFGDAITSSAASPVHTYGATGFYNVNLIITSQDGCTDTVTKVINVEITGINDLKVNNKLSIYPNPSKGKLKISCHEILGNANVTVINSIGQVVYKNEDATFTNGSIELNLVHVASGLYNIAVNNKNTIYTTNVVITK